MDVRAFYQANLDLIQNLISITSKRRMLNEEDAADFGSYTHMKIMDNDFRILRGFKGNSQLKTYLTIVIQRLFQDYRNHRWGKWRLSAEATRLGEPASLLETLVTRDKLNFEQAYQVITTNHRFDITRDQLAELAAKLPVRIARKPVPLDIIDYEPTENTDVDISFKTQEWQALKEKTETALGQVLDEMEPGDRRIVKMYYLEGVKVVQIARVLQMDQKPLYKKLKRLLKKLRQRLESMGVRKEHVAEVIGKTYGSISLKLSKNPGKKFFSPSNLNGGNHLDGDLP